MCDTSNGNALVRSHGITQCYLPPDRDDSHAFTPGFSMRRYTHLVGCWPTFVYTMPTPNMELHMHTVRCDDAPRTLCHPAT